MFRKKTALLFVFLWVVLPCAHVFGLTHDLFDKHQIAWINAHREDTVTFLIFDMPTSAYFFYENDTPRGTAVDIGNLFTEKTGIKVKYELFKSISDLKDELRTNPLAVSFLDEQNDSTLTASAQGVPYVNRLYAKSNFSEDDCLAKDKLTVGYIHFDIYSAMPISADFHDKISYVPFETFESMYESYKNNDIDMFVANETIHDPLNQTTVFLNDSPRLKNIVGHAKVVSVFNTMLEKENLTDISNQNAILYNRKADHVSAYVSHVLDNRKPLKVGFYEHPPYQFMMDQRIPFGVFVSLFNSYQKTLGFPFTTVRGDYSDICKRFQAHELDMIVCCDLTDTHSIEAVNPTPVFDMYKQYTLLSGKYVAYSTFDQPPLTLIPPGHDTVIGYSSVFKYYVDTGRIKPMPHIHFVYYDTDDKLIAAMRHKEVDYILFDEYTMNQDALAEIEYKGAVAQYAIKVIVNNDFETQKIAETFFESDSQNTLTKTQYIQLLNYSTFLNVISPAIENKKIAFVQIAYAVVCLLLFILLVVTIPSIIATTRKRKENLARMHYLQRTDKLTKLLHRHEFLHVVSARFKRREPFLFFLLSIDQLNMLNEHDGIASANRALEFFATVLLDIPEAYDPIVSRLDGNEFALVVTYDKEKTSKQWVEAIFSSMHKSLAAFTGSPLTVSAGISAFPEDGLDFEILYRKADEMLTRSVKNGGHTYHIF